MPTLAELANASPPADLDGQSLVATLGGSKTPRDGYLYWEFPAYGGQQAIRQGKWKAIRQM